MVTIQYVHHIVSECCRSQRKTHIDEWIQYIYFILSIGFNYITTHINIYIDIDYQPGLLLRSRGRSPDNVGRGEAKQTLTRRARLTWLLKIKQLALPIIFVIFTAFALTKSSHSLSQRVLRLRCGAVSTVIGLQILAQRYFSLTVAIFLNVQRLLVLASAEIITSWPVSENIKCTGSA